MNRLRKVPLSGVSIDQVRAEVEKVGSKILSPVADGSGRSRGPDTEEGWINGLSNVWLVNREEWLLTRFPVLSVAIMNLSIERGRGDARLVEGAMLNALAPGGHLKPHRDGAPFHERWHLPIWTNPEVEYWEEKLDGPIHMPVGEWSGPIDHSSLHWMRNDGPSTRVHLIVDLERKF